MDSNDKVVQALIQLADQLKMNMQTSSAISPSYGGVGSALPQAVMPGVSYDRSAIPVGLQALQSMQSAGAMQQIMGTLSSVFAGRPVPMFPVHDSFGAGWGMYEQRQLGMISAGTSAAGTRHMSDMYSTILSNTYGSSMPSSQIRGIADSSANFVSNVLGNYGLQQVMWSNPEVAAGIRQVTGDLPRDMATQFYFKTRHLGFTANEAVNFANTMFPGIYKPGSGERLQSYHGLAPSEIAEVAGGWMGAYTGYSSFADFGRNAAQGNPAFRGLDLTTESGRVAAGTKIINSPLTGGNQQESQTIRRELGAFLSDQVSTYLKDAASSSMDPGAKAKIAKVLAESVGEGVEELVSKAFEEAGRSGDFASLRKQAFNTTASRAASRMMDRAAIDTVIKANVEAGTGIFAAAKAVFGPGASAGTILNTTEQLAGMPLATMVAMGDRTDIKGMFNRIYATSLAHNIPLQSVMQAAAYGSSTAQQMGLKGFYGVEAAVGSLASGSAIAGTSLAGSLGAYSPMDVISEAQARTMAFQSSIAWPMSLGGRAVGGVLRLADQYAHMGIENAGLVGLTGRLRSGALTATEKAAFSGVAPLQTGAAYLSSLGMGSTIDLARELADPSNVNYASLPEVRNTQTLLQAAGTRLAVNRSAEGLSIGGREIGKATAAALTDIFFSGEDTSVKIQAVMALPEVHMNAQTTAVLDNWTKAKAAYEADPTSAVKRAHLALATLSKNAVMQNPILQQKGAALFGQLTDEINRTSHGNASALSQQFATPAIQAMQVAQRRIATYSTIATMMQANKMGVDETFVQRLTNSLANPDMSVMRGLAETLLGVNGDERDAASALGAALGGGEEGVKQLAGFGARINDAATVYNAAVDKATKTGDAVDIAEMKRTEKALAEAHKAFGEFAVKANPKLLAPDNSGLLTMAAHINVANGKINGTQQKALSKEVEGFLNTFGGVGQSDKEYASSLELYASKHGISGTEKATFIEDITELRQLSKQIKVAGGRMDAYQIDTIKSKTRNIAKAGVDAYSLHGKAFEKAFGDALEDATEQETGKTINAGLLHVTNIQVDNPMDVMVSVPNATGVRY